MASLHGDLFPNRRPDSAASLLRSIQEAECIPLDLVSICDGNMLKLVTAHANALGVAAETILMQTLTCVAGFLGRSHVQVNEDWKEQCALWCAIGVNKGLKKTSILNRFVNAMEDVDAADSDNEDAANASETSFRLVPDIRVDYMNSAEFQDLCNSCPASAVGLYENVNVFVRSVQSSSHPVHRQSLKRMYDVNSNKSRVPVLSLNGFIPTEQLPEFLNDVEISSRFLLMCPEEDILHSTEYKMPMPANTPPLKSIFDVLARKHCVPQVYHLCESALLEFIQYYDSLIPKQKQAQEAGNQQSFCVLSKSSGHLIRLSCALGALRQALKFVVYHEDVDVVPWNTSITRDDIEGAKLIWEHVLATKIVLLQNNMIPKQHNMNGDTASSNSLDSSSPNTRKRAGDEQMINSFPKRQSMMASDKPELMTAPPGSKPDSQDGRRMMQSYGLPMNLGNPVFPEMMNLISSNQHGTMSANQQAMHGKHAMQEAHMNGTANMMTTHANVMLQNSNMNARAMQQLKMEQQTYASYDDMDDEDDADTSPLLAVQRVFDKDAIDGTFTDEDVDMFINKYGDRVKKLLEYKNDYKITPSTCAQRHLMPPLSKRDMVRLDTQTRFPVVWAKQFLNIVAKIGFGTIEVYLHPSNNRQSHYFQKKRFEDLSTRERTLLSRLRVTELDFKAGFYHPNDGAPVPHVYISRPYIPPQQQQHQQQQRAVQNNTTNDVQPSQISGEVTVHGAVAQQPSRSSAANQDEGRVKAEPLFDQTDADLNIQLPSHLNEAMFDN